MKLTDSLASMSSSTISIQTADMRYFHDRENIFGDAKLISYEVKLYGSYYYLRDDRGYGCTV